MYYVYLIGSIKKNKLKTYVGYTNNLKKRLFLHNSSKGAKSTRGRKWKILHIEKFFLKSKALSREYCLKKDKKFRSRLKSKI